MVTDALRTLLASRASCSGVSGRRQEAPAVAIKCGTRQAQVEVSSSSTCAQANTTNETISISPQALRSGTASLDPGQSCTWQTRNSAFK
ncbi:hypothetical protein ON010_g19168 [Phytophthora cinnamomi]|nr:hypothetical protein ON010_g19168 [Phytophthora cinnamomi]